MARVFISCNHKDFHVGKKLKQALERRKHVMTLRINAKPAGRWQEQLLHGLHKADAFISLLTPNGMNSNWVVGQTGMAISSEYTKHHSGPAGAPSPENPKLSGRFPLFLA